MGFFLTLLIYAALAVLSDLLIPKPKTQDAKPAGLGAFQFPTATEGRMVSMMWGTVRIRGQNVIWTGDKRQDPITKTQKTGLFSSEDITVGYKYKIGWQGALCMGGVYPVDELTRVWIKDEEVFSGSVTHGGTFTVNRPTLFGGDDLGNGGVVGTMQFFAGTNTQTASAYLSSFQKLPPITGDTPEYHDICYIAPYQNPPYLGNSTSIEPWDIELRRTPNPLSIPSGKHIINSGDANPVNVLYEILTTPGLGFDLLASDINTANWISVGQQLFDEGNGFSFLLDNVEDVENAVRRIEEQIDGIIYQNPFTGKYEIKLVRDDYDPLLVPEINDDNLIEVSGFTKGTWEGTKNQVRVPFVSRDDDYKDTYGFAQDMANLRIQGRVAPASITHPGIKDRDLANSIAWRELRTLAIPLATGEFAVTRALYGVLPGDVVAFTSADLGYTRLPMRVRRANYGELLDGKITLSLVQDIWKAAAGSFAPPPNTNWTPPTDVLVPFPADEQLAFEAPRAFTLRDPLSSSPYVDKVFASARRQGVEVTFRMMERHAAGTPVGAFAEFGQVFAFQLIGELSATLPVGSTYPATSITLVPTPDSQSALETVFPDITDLVDLGTELVTLIMVGNEFMLVSSAQTSGANVQLNNVYRGVLDSVQQPHASGDKVYLIFVGGGMSEGTIAAGQNVHVKLLPRSTTDEVLEAAATQIAFSMDDRVRRPYPPSELSINGTRFDSTVSLEGGAGSGEAIGIDITFVRRDFRTTDEIASLLDDAAAIDPSYPAANSTTHEVDVIDDPGGTPVLLFTQDLAALASGSITRLAILKATDGALPTSLRFALRAVHDFAGTSFDSRYDLEWDMTISSALTGQFEFGALDTNDVSAAFVVDDDTQPHVFTLSSSFVAGDVERRINGGAWTTLIAAGGTSGTILAAALNNGDTIEIRHLSSDVGALKLVTMDDGAPAAFGVLYV